MAETLGSICDKLTVVKLKQWHCDDEQKLASLNKQAQDLQAEIDAYLAAALQGEIPVARLTFAANKIYNPSFGVVREAQGSMGEAVAELAKVNCSLWHVQEKVYEFEQVAAQEKDQVIRELATLNLERNRFIDLINQLLQAMVLEISPGS